MRRVDIALAAGSLLPFLACGLSAIGTLDAEAGAADAATSGSQDAAGAQGDANPSNDDGSVVSGETGTDGALPPDAGTDAAADARADADAGGCVAGSVPLGGTACCGTTRCVDRSGAGCTCSSCASLACGAQWCCKDSSETVKCTATAAACQ